MSTYNREKTVSTSEFERLAEEFIGSTLDMSEQCLHSGMKKGFAKAAIQHAALNAMYGVKAFLALVKLVESDE